MKNKAEEKKNKAGKLLKGIFEARYLYLMVLPAVAFYLIFAYWPMYGIQIAFKDYYPKQGIMGSPWNGFDNFKFIFGRPEFFRALRNTVMISAAQMALGFLCTITLALLINELRMKKYKRVAQTILTFPNFLTWVIIAGFVQNLFSNGGFINNLIQELSGKRIDFMAKPGFFLVLLFVTEIWKSTGWGSIVYLAAMSGIDQEMYEAAYLDGAGRIRCMFKITLPSIKPTIILLLILSAGGILGGNFDQIFNLYNPMVYEYADILDTYIFRLTFGTAAMANPGVPAAVGLFKSVVGCILVLSVDRIAKLCGERGII